MDDLAEQAKQFKSLRLVDNLTQAEFGKLLGVTRLKIDQLEAGQKPFSQELLAALDQQFGKHLSEVEITEFLLLAHYAPSWLVELLLSEEELFYLLVRFQRLNQSGEKAEQRRLVRRVLDAMSEALVEE